MKIKLTDKYEDLEVGSVIEIDDKDIGLFKDISIQYTDQIAKTEQEQVINKIKQEVKNMSMEVKKEVEAPNVIIKNDKVIDSIGKMAQKLYNGEVKSFNIDVKAPAGLNETTAADGGYLVQHDLSKQIFGRLIDGGIVTPKVTKLEVGPNANGMKLPYFNVTTQSTTSMPRLYNVAEGGSKTVTKLAFGQHDLSLTKLVALVPLTDELLQDVVTLESYVMAQLMGQFAWKTDYNILFGTAAATGHIGVLGGEAGAFVTTPVAHAATPTVAMINKLANGVHPSLRAGAEWYMSGSAWSNVLAALGPGVASLLVPIARQEGNVKSLLGYPVNVVDGMVAINNASDILFGNFANYAMIYKGGIQVDISKEYYWDTDQTCLRLVQRTAGAPTWAKYTALDALEYGAFSANS